ncbi:MAG: type 2 isopentenyl-diphosphate Delta-isomerase [Myxococcota bacterium]
MSKLRRVEDKLAHIQATLDGGAEVAGSRAGALTLADLRFLPKALPEVDLGAVNLRTSFLGKVIAAPFMVAPMTGGIAQGGELNRRMAAAAEAHQLPFGVGSQRVALEDPACRASFEVRSVAPTIPILANLGAIQLTQGYGAEEALRAVEMVEGDGLYLHLNAMQEVVQEGGDVSWSGVLSQIERLCTSLHRVHPSLPVLAREVGFGLAADDVTRLRSAGVQGLDCAGAGGTSWTLVEGRVAKSDAHRQLGDVFAAWGLTTPEAILEARSVDRDMLLISSGGIRSGLDVAKCVGLGADVAGIASPVLSAAHQSEAEVHAYLEQTMRELRAVLFGVGAPDVAAFQRLPRLFGPARRLPSEQVWPSGRA